MLTSVGALRRLCSLRSRANATARPVVARAWECLLRPPRPHPPRSWYPRFESAHAAGPQGASRACALALDDWGALGGGDVGCYCACVVRCWLGALRMGRAHVWRARPRLCVGLVRLSRSASCVAAAWRWTARSVLRPDVWLLSACALRRPLRASGLRPLTRRLRLSRSPGDPAAQPLCGGTLATRLVGTCARCSPA